LPGSPPDVGWPWDAGRNCAPTRKGIDARPRANDWPSSIASSRFATGLTSANGRTLLVLARASSGRRRDGKREEIPRLPILLTASKTRRLSIASRRLLHRVDSAAKSPAPHLHLGMQARRRPSTGSALPARIPEALIDLFPDEESCRRRHDPARRCATCR